MRLRRLNSIRTAVAIVSVLAVASIATAQQRPPLKIDGPQLKGPLELSGSFVTEKPGPVEQRARPVTPDNPIPRRTIFVAPRYPDSAALVEARVVVALRVTIDESGYVAEVRRIGAPLLGAWSHPLLRDDAMSSVFDEVVAASTDAVRLWRYDTPNDGPISFDVSISFAPDMEPRIAIGPVVDPR
jgi:hypothetical protein